MTDSGNRRFSEQEFALILRRAQDLQEGAPDVARAGRSAGLTLPEIRQIAAEVGIDARFIEMAATTLPAAPQPSHVLTGAPWQWEIHRVVSGQPTEDQKGRVLDAIRTVIKQKGDIETVYGRFEWTYDDELGPVQVRVVPDQGATRVEVSAQRGGEAGMVFGLPVGLGGVIGGAALAATLGVGGPAALPLMALSGVGIWAGARVFWRGHSERWRKKLELLSERVTAAVEDRPPGTGEGA